MSVEVTDMMEDDQTQVPMSLDYRVNGNDGRLVYYRGELYLNEEELAEVNKMFGLAGTESVSGKFEMIEVQTPPILPAIYSPTAPSAPTSLLLPHRSTRTSVRSSFVADPPKMGNGKGRGEGVGKAKSVAALGTSVEPSTKQTSMVTSVSSSKLANPDLASTALGNAAPHAMPVIKANREKIQMVIRECCVLLLSDPDYRCLSESPLEDTQSVGGPPVSLPVIGAKAESGQYADHFQFMHDVVRLCMYWLQGPPVPNPMLSQYMAALKLSRHGTELMMSLANEISNEDYYEGPNVAETIRIETKQDEQKEQQHKSTVSPIHKTHARKVRRTMSSVEKSKELKEIEQQVNLLTQHVLDMKHQGSTHPVSRGGPGGGQSTSIMDQPLSADEIRKLESDLLALAPEDVDHIIGNLLKDEPSVRVDDDSYELDITALPPAKQRNLRRYVTRKINTRDPSFGTQKMKQFLKDDERARASEEIAERLLAMQYAPAAASPPAAIPSIPSPAAPDPEAERIRIQREEEAKRLWQLAHGDDDEMADDE